MLNKVYCGSGTSLSPKTTSDTSLALGSSSPVRDTVGDETPSPYFAERSRPYLKNNYRHINKFYGFRAFYVYLLLATPNNGFRKLLHEPSNVRYRDFAQDAGSALHVIAEGLLTK